MGTVTWEKGEKMPKLVDKDELKKAIQENICQVMCDEPRGCSNCRVDDVWDVIYEQPTVDAEPVKQERCEFCKDGKTFLGAVLVLGNDDNWHRIKYCPNCGAKMDEPTDTPTDT